MTTRQLRTLAAASVSNPSGNDWINVEDVCIPTRGLDLLLRGLFPGLSHTEQDVGAHGTTDQHRASVRVSTSVKPHETGDSIISYTYYIPKYVSTTMHISSKEHPQETVIN